MTPPFSQKTNRNENNQSKEEEPSSGLHKDKYLSILTENYGLDKVCLNIYLYFSKILL